MSRPRALDLFCGAGGASVGLHRAGFDVLGVDIKPQPNYPLRFIQADAMTFPLDGFDFIWASPPCQAFSQMGARWRGKSARADTHPKLIAPIRERLRSSGAAWCIENVVGARKHMRGTITLHGGMFGLGVHRPRLFEASFLILHGGAPRVKEPIGVYGERPDGRRLWTRQNGDMKGKRSIMRCAKSNREGSRAMGIHWMEWSELKESIPPAYAEFIGRAALAELAALT